MQEEQITYVNGVAVRNEVPRQANSFRGIALVLGTGRNVWGDLRAAESILYDRRRDVICVNDICMHYRRPVVHICAIEHKFMKGIAAVSAYRRQEYTHNHSTLPAEGVTCVWDIANNGGTSSLFAVKVALACGYNRVILAGVPLDRSGHYYDGSGVETDYDCRAIRAVWDQAAAEVFAGRVRSMSGQTREFLGFPDDQWLIRGVEDGK